MVLIYLFELQIHGQIIQTVHSQTTIRQLKGNMLAKQKRLHLHSPTTEVSSDCSKP